MNISATFIHKPIATGMLMAAILLLGLIGYELLPVPATVCASAPGSCAVTRIVGESTFGKAATGNSS